MRQRAQRCGRETLLRTGVHRRRVIEIGLTIDDLAGDIAEAGRGQQAGGLQRERSAGAGGRAVHAIACQGGLRIPVPVQDDALIARSAHQSGRRLDGEPDLKCSRQEENLENQSALHSRAVLDKKQHITQDVLNAKRNIDSPTSCGILAISNTTRVQPKMS